MAKVKIGIWLVLVALSACAQANNLRQATKPLTPEQVAAVHGKLFQAGSAGQIQQQLEATKGDVTLRSFGMSSEIGIDLPLDARLLNLTCQSDAVIIGRAGTWESHPTANEGFIYTDWKFTVTQVLKHNAKDPIGAGTTIIVTRPGGMLEIGGRKVYAKLTHFRDFVRGEELLLYLHYIPATGAYSMREPNYFGVSNEILKAARDEANATAKDCGGTYSK